MRQWRGGAKVGAVYDIGERMSVGYCFMRGRIKDGDIAMVVAHSGDCFYTYQIIRTENVTDGATGRRIYKAEGPRFGAYAGGELHDWQPNDVEFHLLMAGERVLGPKASWWKGDDADKPGWRERQGR